MTVVSYRLYCQDCNNDNAIREEDLDDSPWKVVSLPYHEGLCPACNDAVNLDDLKDGDEYEEEIQLEQLDHIGEKAANNLHRAGYDTVETVAKASDDEILDVAWVGEKGLFSLKEAAKQLDPQQRWQE